MASSRSFMCSFPPGPVAIRIWTMDVGRIKMLFLDTNTPLNARPEDRAIASQLYGGDNDTRIRQEIVLGIGGMRALEVLGYKPTVFHMNEGHSAFLAIERIRLFIERQKLTFEEALEATRVNNVFTTHTPVPAGIDLFDPGLVYHYFNQFCRDAKIEFDRFMALGRRNPQDGGEPLSMAILALNTSAYRNAVSRLHRRGFAGDVALALAHAADLGNADHLGHQRRPPAQLDQRRSGRSLRSVSRTRLAQPLERPGGLEPGSATFRTKNFSRSIAAASAV